MNWSAKLEEIKESSERINMIKDEIIGLLRSTNREGIENLVSFLEKSDYFVAPSSTIYHCNYEGGLATHSMNVLKCLRKINEDYNLSYEDSSLIISALCHDLCKVGFYKLDEEPATNAQLKYLASLMKGMQSVADVTWTKSYASKAIEALKGGSLLPEYQPGYRVEDQFPCGHGEKSVIVAQRFIKLTIHEVLAIRWHMITFDIGVQFDYPSGYPFREAAKKCNLLHALFLADYMSANFLE